MSCLNCKSKKIKKKFKSLFKSVSYAICGECGCHYQDPIIKYNYANEDFWTRSIDPDGNLRDNIKEKEFKIKNWYGDAINFTNKFNNIDVLDVGCGLGFFLSALNKDINKYGLEESSFAIKYIKNNYDDVAVYEGKFEKLEFIEKKFDIIMFYHVIEHFFDQTNTFRLLKKRLKKNGILILGTPLIGTLISNYFGKNYRLYNTSHTILFNLKSLKELHKKNSFEIIKIEKPFLKTEYNTLINFLRLFNPLKLSPPFYGSIVTIYSKLND